MGEWGVFRALGPSGGATLALGRPQFASGPQAGLSLYLCDGGRAGPGPLGVRCLSRSEGLLNFLGSAGRCGSEDPAPKLPYPWDFTENIAPSSKIRVSVSNGVRFGPDVVFFFLPPIAHICPFLFGCPSTSLLRLPGLQGHVAFPADRRHRLPGRTSILPTHFFKHSTLQTKIQIK